MTQARLDPQEAEAPLDPLGPLGQRVTVAGTESMDTKVCTAPGDHPGLLACLDSQDPRDTEDSLVSPGSAESRD